MKGKNKLVPRLLGITKECVMRVDEKTKEVIQEWNLTNIKRWAASPKSFTLVSLGAQRRKGFEIFREGAAAEVFPSPLGQVHWTWLQKKGELELLQEHGG